MTSQPPTRGRIRRGWDALTWLWAHSIGWVLAWALILPIRAYQILISPLTPPSCRFHPSCSAYAVEAIRTHGAVKGFALGTWRVVRCNPWNDGGVDPVPARGHWLPDVLPNGEQRSGTMRARGAADSNV
jgi:putative membrane protein insertion efficiency factor